jgi:RNA polymerase sigma-70 factor (ECF subfamily)
MPDHQARDARWREAMRAALDGDAGAYRMLLSELTPFLRALCRSVCARAGLPAAEAEDAVQETLLAIHLKRHTWDKAQAFTPWAAAIARNKIVDAARRRGRRAETDLGDFENVLAAPPETEHFEREQERADALRLLDGLSERQRAAVEAVSLRGESPRAAAERLGMTEVTLRVNVHRGLKALAALYRNSRA